MPSSLKQLEGCWGRPEGSVQTGLVQSPSSSCQAATLPRKHIVAFVEHGGVACVAEVFAQEEAGKTCSGDALRAWNHKTKIQLLKGPGAQRLNESFLKSGRASCSGHFPPPLSWPTKLLPSNRTDPSRTAVHRPPGRRSNSWPIPPKLPFDLDSDNEFLWDGRCLTVQSGSRTWWRPTPGKDLSEYNLRRIGSELLRGTIRAIAGRPAK